MPTSYWMTTRWNWIWRQMRLQCEFQKAEIRDIEDKMSEQNHQTENWQPETLAVRAGAVRSQFGENSEALFLTSSFVFDSAAQAAARFIGEQLGNIYSRFTNPTVTMFEERLPPRHHPR